MQAPLDSPLSVQYARLLPHFFKPEYARNTEVRAFFEQVVRGDGDGGVVGHKRYLNDLEILRYRVCLH